MTTPTPQNWHARAEKAEAELAEWRKVFPEKAAHEVMGMIVGGRAQVLAYEEALKKILAATNDPWGWNQATIAGICNEALSKTNPTN